MRIGGEEWSEVSQDDRFDVVDVAGFGGVQFTHGFHYLLFRGMAELEFGPAHISTSFHSRGLPASDIQKGGSKPGTGVL